LLYDARLRLKVTKTVPAQAECDLSKLQHCPERDEFVMRTRLPIQDCGLTCTESTLNNAKSFPSNRVHTVALIFHLRLLSLQLDTSLHCETIDTGLMHYVVSAYASVFAVTYYTCVTYPRRAGQSELTWVTGCILRWFTRTSRARRRLRNLVDLTQRLILTTKLS